MTDNRILKLLAKLSRKEMTRFAAFALSPYFNKHADVKAVVNYLSNVYPEFGEKNCGREVFSRILFPQKKYDQARLAVIFTYTFRLLRQFLILEQAKSEHLFDENREKLFSRIKTNLLNKEGIIIFGYANPYHPVQLIWGYLTQKVLFDKTHVYNWNIENFKKIVALDFDIIKTEKTSPFTKMISMGKHFKGDILVFARNRN